MSVQFSFAGQVVFVTGGATGLGLATALAFGRAGASVALNDLTTERAAGACRVLRDWGINCRGYAADVRDGSMVRAMVSAIERDLGRLDIAVANAGIYPNTPFLDVDEEEWRRVIDTNLTGVFLTCQAAARAMVRGRRGGRIITLSSGAANSAIWGWSHYSAAKAGVVMLTRGMALELAPHGIRVNAILPGYIDVPEGGAHLDPGYKARARDGVPLGRSGTPDDIANAALLLASPLSDYVTGTTLVVDGGSSAGRVGLRPARE
jgi:NAD(P)-dependent dehydrogenase (short-subunit alcohol dehydrogenase family)